MQLAMNILGKEKYFNGIQRTPEPMDLSELSPEEPESSECLKNLNGHMTLICDTPSSSASLTYTKYGRTLQTVCRHHCFYLSMSDDSEF